MSTTIAIRSPRARTRFRLGVHTHTRPDHDVVYSNKLPLNHDTSVRPALQERRLIVGIGEQRLLLPWLGALPREVATDATVEAPSLAGATPALPFLPSGVSGGVDISLTSL
jgi:hypothetical protein